MTFGAEAGGLYISRNSPVLQAQQKSTLMTSEVGKSTLEPGWKTPLALQYQCFWPGWFRSGLNSMSIWLHQLYFEGLSKGVHIPLH